MDNKLKYFIVTAALGVIIFAVYHFFFYNKMKAKIEKLEKKYQRISMDLQTARLAANRLPQLEIEIKKLQYLWEKAIKLLPTKEKPEEIINLLQQRATQNGVKINKLTRNAPVAKGEYTELPYSLEVTANYHDLVKFISELSTLSRLVTVEGIKITTSKTDEKTCSASFVAKFYSVGTAAGAKVEKKKGVKPKKGKKRRKK